MYCTHLLPTNHLDALVVIDHLDFCWTTGSPDEAQPELVIDPNAVLPRTIPAQGFQPVAWRCREENKRLSGFQLR